ncbi:hypothetical protein D3C76_1153060 [compost metagenome]
MWIAQATMDDLQALQANPLAEAKRGSGEQFVHVAHGQTAGVGDHLWREVERAQVFFDVIFDALQVQCGQARALAIENPIILAQGHQQGRLCLLQQHVAGREVTLVKSSSAHRQLVNENPPQAALGVETKSGVTLSTPQLTVQGTLGKLEDPEVIVAGVVETIRRVPTLEDEAAGLAVQLATVLFEVDFGSSRHSDQVTGFTVFADLCLTARVTQLARAQPG